MFFKGILFPSSSTAASNQTLNSSTTTTSTPPLMMTEDAAVLTSADTATTGGSITLTLAPLTNTPSSMSPNTDKVTDITQKEIDENITTRMTVTSETASTITNMMMENQVTTKPPDVAGVPSPSVTMTTLLTTLDEITNGKTNTEVTEKGMTGSLTSSSIVTDSTNMMPTQTATLSTTANNNVGDETTKKMVDASPKDEVDVDDKIDDEGFSTFRPSTKQSFPDIEDLGKLQIEMVVTLASVKSVFSG